ERVYRTYAADVHRFALWMTGDPAQADDLTSETFVRAWTRRKKIRAETLKAYLLAIARNLHLEQRRKQKRRGELPADVLDPAPGPDRLAEGKAELDRIRRLLATLPECEATALILRAQQGLSYEEVALILEIPLSSARVKVHRARKKIWQTLEKKEDSIS
ncbi:MAG: RNA polymerase sigma factor, partial [Candidatus Aminicenantes bacterium]|nr:RNA polymerase sigma factor [Candidatus Aminicenantes bacterium]